MRRPEMRLLFAGYIKTGVNTFFDNKKGSKKSNGENTIKFMTFLKIVQCYCQ